MSSGWSWSPSGPLANIDANSLHVPLPSLAKPPFLGTGNRAVPPPGGRTDENTAPNHSNAGKKSAAPAPKATSAPKKRKSDAIEEKEDLFPEDVAEIDDDDPRLWQSDAETCNAIRKKIRTWIESGAMKIGEFQAAIGVSSKAYSSFMNRNGTWDGDGCDTYVKASTFFKKRELQGLPLKATNKPKKAKAMPGAKATSGTKGAADLLDVSGIELPNEEGGNVPVYDTCNEVRRKIRALIGKEGVTQAAFAREISKTFRDGRTASPANLRYFLGQKGPRGGNTSTTFYAAYVFFEKQRIKSGKPKSKLRLEMEDVHGWEGMDTVHGGNTMWVCAAERQPYMDKYGRITF